MAFPAPLLHIKQVGRHGTWSSGDVPLLSPEREGTSSSSASSVPTAAAADHHHHHHHQHQHPQAKHGISSGGGVGAAVVEASSSFSAEPFASVSSLSSSLPSVTSSSASEVVVEVGGWKVLLSVNPRTGHLLVQTRTPVTCPHQHQHQQQQQATTHRSGGGGLITNKPIATTPAAATSSSASASSGSSELDGKSELKCKLFRCCAVKGMSSQQQTMTVGVGGGSGGGERGRAPATVVNNPLFNNPKLKKIIGPSSPARPRRSRSRSRRRKEAANMLTRDENGIASPISPSTSPPPSPPPSSTSSSSSSTPTALGQSASDALRMNFNSLPEEVQLHIFSFLSPVDVLSMVPTVCRHWRDLTRDDTLWKILQEEHFGGPRRNERSWNQECILALTRIKRQTQRYQTEMLLWGAKHGHIQFVRRMLREFNIDVNVRSHKSEASPLHLAAAQGHYETVELLLAHGADVNAKTSYGRTPLERAARYGHAAIVQLLIFRGAQVNATTEGGETPLLMAAGNNHKKVVKILLSHDADVTAASAGFTAMRIATLQGYTEIVQLLQAHAALGHSASSFGPSSSAGQGA